MKWYRMWFEWCGDGMGISVWDAIMLFVNIWDKIKWSGRVLLVECDGMAYPYDGTIHMIGLNMTGLNKTQSWQIESALLKLEESS